MKKERTFVNPFKLFFGASENYNQLSQSDAIDSSNLSAEEKAELKKALKEVEKFEKEIQIRVTNFGLIIPKESLTRIFDSFYRVEDSRSVQTGGTGLGLNIARQIVLLHDGAIKVESDTDGTCFTIALPLNMQK